MEIISHEVKKLTLPKTVKINGELDVDITNILPIGKINKTLIKQELNVRIKGISNNHRILTEPKKIWTPLYVIAIRDYLLSYYPVYKLSLVDMKTNFKYIPEEFIEKQIAYIPISQDSDEFSIDDIYVLNVKNESQVSNKIVYTHDIKHEETGKSLPCNNMEFIELHNSTYVNARFKISLINTNIVTLFAYDPSKYEDMIDVVVKNNGEINIVTSWNFAVEQLINKLETLREIAFNNFTAIKQTLNNCIAYTIKLPSDMNVLAKLIIDNICRLPSSIIAHSSVLSTFNTHVNIQLHISVPNDVYKNEDKYQIYYQKFIVDSIAIVNDNLNKLLIK